MIEIESKIRDEAFNRKENFLTIIESIEINELEGISMIWRIYMYLVSTTEPVISKNIVTEIMQVFSKYQVNIVCIL